MYTGNEIHELVDIMTVFIEKANKFVKPTCTTQIVNRIDKGKNYTLSNIILELMVNSDVGIIYAPLRHRSSSRFQLKLMNKLVARELLKKNVIPERILWKAIGSVFRDVVLLTESTAYAGYESEIKFQKTQDPPPWPGLASRGCGIAMTEKGVLLVKKSCVILLSSYAQETDVTCIASTL